MNSEQLRRLWETRPVRVSHGSTVAGVCGGIGLRYRVDPTLIKVAFIISTLFGGSGLALYIAAWVAFPSSTLQVESDPIHRRFHRSHGVRGIRSMLSHPPTIALIVVVAVIAGVFSPNNTWTMGTMLGLVLMLLGWWLLYQHQPDADPGTSADTVGQETAAGAASTAPTAEAPAMSWISTSTTATTATADTVPIDRPGTGPIGDGPRQPPAWDPLGAAPFAWDLPDPSPTPPPPPVVRRSSRLTPVTMGTALLTAAIGTALATAAGIGWLTAAKISALALAVLGVGLVIAAFRYRLPDDRRGAALAWITVPVLALTVAAAALPAWKSSPGGVGDRTWRPITTTDIASKYSLTIGSASVDLTGLALDADRQLTLQVGLGEAKIYVPDDMRVRAQCEVSVGDVKCPDGTVGPASGPLLTVHARANIGQVTLIRGRSAPK
ncbi:PspC domain-containing protein [Jongsikchunia kroppenstedtii]|uniref:PspC domain-containing protein n=1 Tax=Jongsikchunia kroppenstedtii TaxID=1121721 RepID=UPI00036B4530|nr:PspC domain-containing protein [Jongsikchunia kroppenstedtii]